MSYFLSCWHFLIKSETNLPVTQQLRSIWVECFQAVMLFSKYVMYFVYWYEWCGTVVAWYEQHSGLTRVYVSCFVVVIGKNRVLIWSVQSWADSSLFLRSKSDGFIFPNSNLRKKRLHSHTYGCFLISGAEVEQFSNIKTSIPCIFYSCLNYYWKKREGEFLATTICPLVTKNLYLIASWHPY